MNYSPSKTEMGRVQTSIVTLDIDAQMCLGPADIEINTKFIIQMITPDKNIPCGLKCHSIVFIIVFML